MSRAAPLVAMCAAVALALASVVWARSRQTGEGFVDPVDGMGRHPYGDAEARVFQAFVSVHGTPPSKVALTHYAYLQKRYGLDDDGILERIHGDVPDADI